MFFDFDSDLCKMLDYHSGTEHLEPETGPDNSSQPAISNLITSESIRILLTPPDPEAAGHTDSL